MCCAEVIGEKDGSTAPLSVAEYALAARAVAPYGVECRTRIALVEGNRGAACLRIDAGPETADMR